MADYNLEVPFGIDNGELRGLSPQDVFVRGFEAGAYWAGARMLSMGMPEALKMIIHSDNEQRVTRFIHAGKCCVVGRQWLNDDWIELVIARILETPNSSEGQQS